MDWPTTQASIAAAFTGLSDGAGTTLRASHAQPPDAIVTPCAVTILRGFEGVSIAGSRVTGRAKFDVLVLLDPTPDVPRRYAAMLRFTGPALVAILAHMQLGNTAEIASVLPVSASPDLAGDSPDYAGLPYDLVRVALEVEFAYTVSVGWS